MYNFKWTAIEIIFICCSIRFGVAKEQEYQLLYNNSYPDVIQFSVKSDYNRYYIENVKCGISVYLGNKRDKTALVTGLTSCKLYECTIEIRNIHTVEKFFNNEKVSSGFLRNVLPIKLLKVVPYTNSFRIELDFQHIDCIDSFYVVLNNSKVIYWTIYNLTKSLNVSDLSPCVNYQMYVFFNHFTGPHELFHRVIRTSPMKQSRIENIVFDPKTDLVKWDTFYHENCTSTYVITVVSDVDGETLYFQSESNEYNLNFLNGCSKYFIIIKPKSHDDLGGTINITTDYKSPQSVVQNVNIKMLNITALSIKWDRPSKNTVCVLEYVVQINGLSIVTTSQELTIPVCNNSHYSNISVCIVRLRTTDNCLTYHFDTNLNKTVGSVTQSTNPIHVPRLYRYIGWGSITMNNFDDPDALLQINDSISTMDNTTLQLIISELDCGANLVPSYKFFNSHNVNDYCTHLVKDNCTKVCELDVIREEVKLNVHEGDSIVCGFDGKNSFALKRGVAYEIMARISIPIGYIDTTPILFPKDRVLKHKSNTILYIIISLFCTGVLLIMLTIRCFCKNRTLIEVQNYSSFYNKIDRKFIEREYKLINDKSLSHLSSTVPYHEMVGKNRVTDVVPYDFNRVIINTGYINASFIDGYKCSKQYIAAQSPTEETVSDFWHMIIEQHCDGIIMLTRLTENDKEQCYQYYPDVNNTIEFTGILITNVEETHVTNYIKRILRMDWLKVSRYIVHYQYTDWPSEDCPSDGFGFVEFVENTGCLNDQSTHPVLVHSCLGVGRTGTFIALDLLFQHLRAEKYISVCDTIKKLRSQRCRMVETIEQYKFLYDCVYKYYLTRIVKRRSNTRSSL